MKATLVFAAAVVTALSLATACVAADVTVLVTREENKPATVEIHAGDSVRWIGATGGVAHISFGDNAAIQFQVGSKESRVKFTEPGTYRYTVHLAGVKAHAHTGIVVVK